VEVRQCLEDTRNLLKIMLRLSTVKEDWLIALQIIGDFNYAWIIIGSFTSMMQNGIKEDPLLVGKLRTIFIKVNFISQQNINKLKCLVVVVVSNGNSAHKDQRSRK